MSETVYKKHAELEGTQIVNKERENIQYIYTMSMQQIGKPVGLNCRIKARRVLRPNIIPKCVTYGAMNISQN